MVGVAKSVKKISDSPNMETLKFDRSKLVIIYNVHTKFHQNVRRCSFFCVDLTWNDTAFF